MFVSSLDGLGVLSNFRRTGRSIVITRVRQKIGLGGQSFVLKP
jgi:hypothetical protein